MGAHVLRAQFHRTLVQPSSELLPSPSSERAAEGIDLVVVLPADRYRAVVVTLEAQPDASASLLVPRVVRVSPSMRRHTRGAAGQRANPG
jgi:hypothetical protein